MNLVFVFFALITLISCTSIAKEEFYLNEIVIRNNSSEIIRDVLIKVEKTGRLFKCSIIAPQGECSNKFQKRKYHGDLVIISWSNRNYSKFTKEIQLSVVNSFISNKPIKGVLEINNIMKINAYLAQD